MSASDSSLPLAFLRKQPGLLQFWADLETSLLGKRVRRPIVAPIFVCGLARSGTTLVTHLLNAHPHVGSFLYRDLPFVELPYLWSFIGKYYYGNQPLKRREHGDKISIDPHSPDAFEELLWRTHLEEYEDGGFCRILDAGYDNSALAEALRLGINKVLYVRGQKSRYLAKGNYNLFRLGYMQKLYPDAKIILCVRDPFSHAHSLARVHQQFSALSAKDSSFADRLTLLCHFEFGPKRKALRLPGGRAGQAIAHWKKGEDYQGYLLQWGDVYAFAKQAYAGNKNILWLQDTSLVQDRSGTLKKILEFCELPVGEMEAEKALGIVENTTRYPIEPTPYDEEMRTLHASLQTLCR